MKPAAAPSVLFVCLGNICRSPAAEGVLREMASKEPRFSTLHIESCGMGDWHVGQLADVRMREAAKGRGLSLSSRAQCFDSSFLDRFDYILAADKQVLRDLFHYAKTPEQRAKIHLITAFSSNFKNEEIPDPYYGGAAGFELVLDMLEDSCHGLLQEIEA